MRQPPTRSLASNIVKVTAAAVVVVDALEMRVNERERGEGQKESHLSLRHKRQQLPATRKTADGVSVPRKSSRLSVVPFVSYR